MAEFATYELIDHMAVVTMDDGKANVFGPDMISALNSQLDRAADEAKVVLLTGRPGLFSGGFDLRVMRGDDRKAAYDLVRAGARLLMRLYGLPQPLVAAATGHAVAMGALCLLAGDYRVGAQGDFRIGLNETAIGMSLPPFAVMITNERLSRRYLARATLGRHDVFAGRGQGCRFSRRSGSGGEASGSSRSMWPAPWWSSTLQPMRATKRGLRGDSIAAVLKGLER